MNLLELILANELESLPYEAIASELNAPTEKPNPILKPPMVNAPLPDTGELYGLINADVETRASDMEAIAAAMEAIKLGKEISDHAGVPHRGNIHTLLEYAEGFGLAGTTVERIKDRLNHQVEDPTWVTTVTGPSIAQIAGLDRVLPEHVQQAMIGFGGEV
jgi:hypothetical protein